RMPLELSVYDYTGVVGSTGKSFAEKDIPGPGYHWYSIKPWKIGPDLRTVATNSWLHQTNLSGLFDAAHPEQTWKVYWSIKLSGPSFPYGRVYEPDAVLIDRMILVKTAPGETLPETLTPVQ
ncbi:MAG TPA: hypothetical protein VGM23_10180, partial [Armatimonadota bacterium]